MKTICYSCQNEMVLVHETVTHTIFKKDISVHNVPVFRCEQCDHAFYQTSRHVEAKLKEAYQRNESDIDFK